MSSLIAIVGRPNVGKSTLFNILTGSRSAIVADFSGLTRDRKYGKVKDSSLVLIDTGGISLEESDMSDAIKKQTENAIEEADMIFFIVDAIEGLLPLDEVIADLLRKQNKRIAAGHMVVCFGKIGYIPEQPTLIFYYYFLEQKLPSTQSQRIE